jgi:hypothetical protein
MWSQVPSFLNGWDLNTLTTFCSSLPADGTRGGVLLACNDNSYQFSDVHIANYTVTVKVHDHNSQSIWSITGVYGPRMILAKVTSFLSSAS